MVMIPVGNRTRHSFKLWCFAEMFIRQIISMVVLDRMTQPELGLTLGVLRVLAILFFVWSWRPVYLSSRSLFYSWRDAKHRAESDLLSEVSD